MLEAIKHVLSENLRNSGRIWILANESSRRQTVRTSIGLGWMVFRDVVYMSVYIGFRYLLAGSREIDGIIFYVYLLVGLGFWFFLSDAINAAPKTISGNKAVIGSFNFPISILPTIEIVSVFIRRLFTLALIFILTWAHGYFSLFDPWLFLYYFFALFVMSLAINMFFSAINAISYDFTQFYQAFTRILIYSVPIIWSFDRIAENRLAVIALKANPLAYIIIGSREAMVGGTPNGWGYTLYFWVFVAILLGAGSYLQYKLAKYYSDFI